MKLRALVLVVFVACGGKEPAPVAPPPSNVSAIVVGPDAGPPDAPMDEIDVVMATMSGFRDDMCKCADKPCADAVQERMTKWSTKMATEAGERQSRKATEEEMRRMTDIGQGYGECMAKAMGATP
jgi:hypothetical protein